MPVDEIKYEETKRRFRKEVDRYRQLHKKTRDKLKLYQREHRVLVGAVKRAKRRGDRLYGITCTMEDAIRNLLLTDSLTTADKVWLVGYMDDNLPYNVEGVEEPTDLPLGLCVECGKEGVEVTCNGVCLECRDRTRF